MYTMRLCVNLQDAPHADVCTGAQEVWLMCQCYDVVRKSAESRQVEQVNMRVLGNMFTNALCSSAQSFIGQLC